MHDQEPLIRVMALHALAYCKRLYYLEEVEELRLADHRVYAGRRLHESLDEDGELVQLQLESTSLGLRGKVDALRRRDGALLPYEHKRGRPRRTDGIPEPWPSDRLQLGAYALLLEETAQRRIDEGRIRYHAENVTVRVPIDEALRQEVQGAVQQARALRLAVERPPVTDNERLCERCSLAPICLPEEARVASEQTRSPLRLFPEDDDRQALHVLGHGARVGRRGEELEIRPREGEVQRAPARTVRSVSVHGYSTVSAQALTLCAAQEIAVHWFRPDGQYSGTFCGQGNAVQRKIRQYEALRDEGFRLSLARRLVHAKVEGQLRFLLRSTQRMDRVALGLERQLEQLRMALKSAQEASGVETLLGYEGQAAAAYFEALPKLVSAQVDPRMRPKGRSKRPPRDRFNALLSVGYGVLLKEVVQAIRAVGLEGAFGFYHRPRSSALPLALDVMELFRVPCVDMAVLGAVNRRQFEPEGDFEVAGEKVWLSWAGRKKLVGVIEQRLMDRWKHPVLKYSLAYRRAIELEVRLLEKEWMGEAGLFGRMRVR